MADDPVIAATRNDIDDVVFSACTEVAETLPGLSVREKTKFAISAADRIMEGIDNLGGAAKRSEAAKKAAAARYAKPQAPKPGPAIPPPPAPSATVSPDMAVANAAIAAGMIPPPPHPSLLPPGATPAPFGAPPA